MNYYGPWPWNIAVKRAESCSEGSEGGAQDTVDWWAGDTVDWRAQWVTLNLGLEPAISSMKGGRRDCKLEG